MKKLFLVFATLFLYAVTVNAAEPENIKIAVASDGRTAESSVSSEAAKCPYYLIFDGKGKLIQVIENRYRDTRRGAGPLAAAFLSEMGVTVAVAESFGSKMIDTLKNKGITHIQFKGTAADAAKRVLNGR